MHIHMGNLRKWSYKNKPYIYRNFFKKRILELKNPFDKFFNMLDIAEEGLNELEDKPRKIMEIIQTE